MRRRSTFIPSLGVDYDPSEVKLQDRHLSFAGLKAAREERLTFGLDELPLEVVEVLQQCHELHIRWQSHTNEARSPPYLSTLTPGLHVHYTPLSDGRKDRLCPTLQRLLSSSLRCKSVEDSFSSPDILADRFAHTASLQYYSPLAKPNQLVAWLQRTVCSKSGVVCKHEAALLNLASYVDIDYDSISHTLSLSVFWSKPPAVLIDPIGEWTTYDHWNLVVDASPSDRNEVGILHATAGEEPAELQMEGFLTVVGEDTQPKPTMFYFPSRHHLLPSTQSRDQQYIIAFEQPTGLHPTLSIKFPSASALVEPTTKPPSSTCALHTYLTLPSYIFADEYAFPTSDPDQIFTEAHNIISLRSLSGEKDLELPDYVIDKWGSALLLELATPEPISASSSSARPSDSTWSIKIPLHLRYLPPNPSGHTNVSIPHPIVFWACTAEEGTKFNVNPFDRVNLGYDGLFGPRTMFYHLEPQGRESLFEAISAPVLNTDVLSFRATELLTLMMVLGGFAWVAWKVVKEMRWETSIWNTQKETEKNQGRKKKKN